MHRCAGSPHTPPVCALLAAVTRHAPVPPSVLLALPRAGGGGRGRAWERRYRAPSAPIRSVTWLSAPLPPVPPGGLLTPPAAPSLAPTAGGVALGPGHVSRVCVCARAQGRGGAWVRVTACRGACRRCQRPCVRPADVDDCADSPCCQQVCSNSPGGYECGCYAGYRLSADGCGCEGEPGAAGGPGRDRGDPPRGTRVRLPCLPPPPPASRVPLPGCTPPPAPGPASSPPGGRPLSP